jgi:hypothetical protein
MIHEWHHVNAPVPARCVRDVIAAERDRVNLDAIE